jgi:hypothetical protein
LVSPQPLAEEESGACSVWDSTDYDESTINDYSTVYSSDSENSDCNSESTYYVEWDEQLKIGNIQFGCSLPIAWL